MSSMSRQSPPVAAGTSRRFARARRLLQALFVLLFGVLATSNAEAAVVPMCSEDGRSIVAPPITVPSRGLVLEAPRPCPQPDSLLVGSLPRDPGGQPTPPSEGPLRVVPLGPVDLPLPYVGRRSSSDASMSTGLELIGSIDRPPRSRA
jgi:hypothetical protein